jgi:signal transduction histidine kinase
LAEHKEVKLRDRTERPVPARGDAKRLGQALNHLVVNAIKFTAAGGEITVNTSDADEPELVITDTGLAIVRSIIEAHHGTIRVESEPGLGTTVRLTLPRPS